MLHAFISFGGNPLTERQHLYFGVALVVASTILIPLILFRFEWLLRFWIFRSGFRWGYRSRGFPASRFGSITGCLGALLIGAMAIDHGFGLIIPEVWLWAWIFIGLLVLIAAVHDYKTHRRSKRLKSEAETKR